MWRSNWAANHVMSSDGAAPRFTLLGIPSPQVPHFADTESVSASYVTVSSGVPAMLVNLRDKGCL